MYTYLTLIFIALSSLFFSSPHVVNRPLNSWQGCMASFLSFVASSSRALASTSDHSNPWWVWPRWGKVMVENNRVACLKQVCAVSQMPPPSLANKMNPLAYNL